MENEKNKISVKDIQNVSLEVLKETLKILNRYGLRYILYYGTLLGAVRHKGFIPWDDDLDIAMPREDFERFKKIANQELGENYFFQDYSTDAEYPAVTAKVRANNTTLIENGYRGLKNMNHGIFIDIFVADWYKPSALNKWRLLKIKLYRNILIAQKDYHTKGLKRFIAKMFSREKTFGKIEKLSLKLDKGQTKNAYLMDYNTIVDKDIFNQTVETPFEDIAVKIPKEYDAYLTKLYGDYMQFPPEEQRKPLHATEHISTQIPYKEYLKNMK